MALDGKLSLAGGAMAGDLDMGAHNISEATRISGKLIDIVAPTGNPEFRFFEASTSRGKVYYDIANNRMTFQNQESNGVDALYFAEDVTATGHIAPNPNNMLNLGSSSLYWANAYMQRHFLNATAYIDESTAGEITVVALVKTAADVEITDATKGVILKSPNGTRFRITAGDDGALTTTEIL